MYGGEKAARENYSEQIKLNPEAEIKIILELAKTRADVYCQIEERAAIRKLIICQAILRALFVVIFCNFGGLQS